MENIDIESILRQSFSNAPGLNPSLKAEAIRKLQAAQAQATGKRAQKIAFLLAAWNSNYLRNRNYLVETLRGCQQPRLNQDCDEETADLLIRLYEEGHHDVLRPLLDAGPRSDAALAETLGEFYSTVLKRTPSKFIDTIRSLPLNTQKEICEHAGHADGGGISQEDFHLISTELNRIGNKVANRCLQSIEKR